MSMLEFPTFEEMVQIMNSPDHPPEPMDSVDMLSSDYWNTNEKQSTKLLRVVFFYFN